MAGAQSRSAQDGPQFHFADSIFSLDLRSEKLAIPVAPGNLSMAGATSGDEWRCCHAVSLSFSCFLFLVVCSTKLTEEVCKTGKNGFHFPLISKSILYWSVLVRYRIRGSICRISCHHHWLPLNQLISPYSISLQTVFKPALTHTGCKIKW